MDALHLRVLIGEDRYLAVELQLPLDMPVGEFELVLRPVSDAVSVQEQHLSREDARQRLLDAGIISTARYAPEDAVPLTLEERRRIGQLPPDTRPSESLIDEERD